MTSFEPETRKRGRQMPFYEELAHRLADLEVPRAIRRFLCA